MSDRTPKNSTFAAAQHAYEGTRHVGEPVVHRLDLFDSLPARRLPPNQPLRSGVATAGPSQLRVTHDVASPAGAGFRFGFGLAAGIWTFRALVLIVVCTALLLTIAHLLPFLLR